MFSVNPIRLGSMYQNIPPIGASGSAGEPCCKGLPCLESIYFSADFTKLKCEVYYIVESE